MNSDGAKKIIVYNC